MALAGFSWGEADSLRKVISKKSREQLSDYRARFEQGCARNGISPEVVESVWDMFTSFSGYSFCKPHSASYALVSFKSAYLKAHHPAEFMAAVISNGGGYYSTFAYISEARRMGLEVLGPDINESRLHYTGRGKTIRTGLQQLQAIRKGAVEAILRERSRGGPFSSIEDFLDRLRGQNGLPISAPDAAILVKSGAMDSISGAFNRPQILWFIEAWLNGFRAPRTSQTCIFRPSSSASRPHSSSPRKCLVRGLSPQSSILSPQSSVLSPQSSLKVPALPDFSAHRKWAHESETLGFPLSVHPLELAEPFFRSLRQPIVPASDMAAHVGKKMVHPANEYLCV
jgi:error-prone DNA polymerase